MLRLAWLLTICVCVAAQEKKPVFEEEVGALGIRRERASWVSPESVARDLRSPDDTVRLKALYLLGLDELQTHERGWALQGQETQVVGLKVVSPDQIDLRYAALGRDSTQQAILAVQVGPMIYAAVAIPRLQGWERVALFDCWCKYDMENALGEFLEIRSAPGGSEGGFELVLRASGGGTGIYMQHEAHYRLYDGTLRRVMSFVSRERLCDPPPNRCSVEYRWFYHTTSQSGPVSVLLEATGGFPVDRVPPAAFSLPEFQSRYATNLTCREYVWNEKEFRYDRSSQQAPCNPRKTQ